MSYTAADVVNTMKELAALHREGVVMHEEAETMMLKSAQLIEEIVAEDGIHLKPKNGGGPIPQDIIDAATLFKARNMMLDLKFRQTLRKATEQAKELAKQCGEEL